MDPVTASTVAGSGMAIWGSKDLLLKLLGPSADYLGGELKGFIEKSHKNVGNIFTRAAEKIGDKINEPGETNSRVLKGVIDEGRFCESEIATEYFGGLLASSRGPNGEDDSAVFLLSFVKAMSSDQLKFHYIVYQLLKSLAKHEVHRLDGSARRKNVKLFIPYNVFGYALNQPMGANISNLLTLCMYGLRHFELIEDSWEVGEAEVLKKKYSEINESGIVVSPSIPGIELFLRSQAKKDSAYDFFDPNIIIEGPIFKIPDGSFLLDQRINVDLRGKDPEKEIITVNVKG